MFPRWTRENISNIHIWLQVGLMKSFLCDICSDNVPIWFPMGDAERFHRGLNQDVHIWI